MREITKWSRKQKQNRDGDKYWVYQITEYKENGRVFSPAAHSDVVPDQQPATN